MREEDDVASTPRVRVEQLHAAGPLEVPVSARVVDEDGGRGWCLPEGGGILSVRSNSFFYLLDLCRERVVGIKLSVIVGGL